MNLSMNIAVLCVLLGLTAVGCNNQSDTSGDNEGDGDDDSGGASGGMTSCTKYCEKEQECDPGWFDDYFQSMSECVSDCEAGKDFSDTLVCFLGCETDGSCSDWSDCQMECYDSPPTPSSDSDDVSGRK